MPKTPRSPSATASAAFRASKRWQLLSHLMSSLPRALTRTVLQANPSSRAQTSLLTHYVTSFLFYRSICTENVFFGRGSFRIGCLRALLQSNTFRSPSASFRARIKSKFCVQLQFSVRRRVMKTAAHLAFGSDHPQVQTASTKNKQYQVCTSIYNKPN